MVFRTPWLSVSHNSGSVLHPTMTQHFYISMTWRFTYNDMAFSGRHDSAFKQLWLSNSPNCHSALSGDHDSIVMTPTMAFLHKHDSAFLHNHDSAFLCNHDLAFYGTITQRFTTPWLSVLCNHDLVILQTMTQHFCIATTRCLSDAVTRIFLSHDCFWDTMTQPWVL